jgi:cytochrome c-type biogenesis protein CcmF
MVVERRGKLKVWTISLVILSFLLAIFGTFVVRSGILSSVHSFAESDIGHLFLTFFSLALVGSVMLLLFRLPQIKDEEGFESPISREAGFLFNNLLLMGIGFATFWGTIYPIITEAFTRDKITVGPPFYQQVNGSLFFVLLLLMGVGPLLAWRQTSTRALIKSIWQPIVVGISAAIVFQFLTQKPFVALSIGALAFVFMTILSEYIRGLTIRKRNTGENYPLALTRLVSRNKQRYGGYVVHVGILLIAIGIIGSTAFQTNREVNMKKGESITIGRYVLTYEESFSKIDSEKEILGSILAVNRGGDDIGIMVPSTEFYNKFQGQPSSKIAISTTFLDDLYIFQASRPEDDQVTLSIFLNPLVMWIWIGGAILIFGILIAAWPEKRIVWTSSARSAKI